MDFIFAHIYLTLSFKLTHWFNEN